MTVQDFKFFFVVLRRIRFAVEGENCGGVASRDGIKTVPTRVEDLLGGTRHRGSGVRTIR
jgi:hypothetical protein